MDRIPGEKCPPHQRIQPVVERPPLIDPSVEIYFLKMSVRRERHTAVEKQVAVVDGIELAFSQKELHMPLQTLAAHKGALKPFHDILFLQAQRVGVLRIDCREIRIPERIYLSVQLDRIRIIIDLLKEVPVHHVIFRPPLYDLPLDLELDDGDRLVNADIHFPLFPGQFAFGLETGARVISISLLGKCRERKQIDPVAFLQDIQIPIARAVPDDIGDAGQLTAGCAHPLDIVIPPLYIQAVVVHENVHNIIRPVAPVINISENMEMVDDQTSRKLRERLDKALRTSDPDDRIDDLLVVGFLILDITALRDQLIDHICIISRHGFSDFGPRVLAGRIFADLDQTVQHDPVPVFHLRIVRDLFLHQLDLLGRIVDQRRQLPDIFFRQRPSVDLIDLLPHRTGTVPDNMRKSLILSVDICDKVLCSFRQIQNRA